MKKLEHIVTRGGAVDRVAAVARRPSGKKVVPDGSMPVDGQDPVKKCKPRRSHPLLAEYAPPGVSIGEHQRTHDELTAANEELTTFNDELQSSIAQVNQLNADLSKLIRLALEEVTVHRQHEVEGSRLLAAAKEGQAQAEQASRAKDVFLATLSHELRTPLSSLLLQAQILGRTKGEPDKVARASKAIERAAKAQARLIDAVLDVSRIADGRLQVHLQVASLPVIVHAAVDILRPTAEKKSLALDVALDESLPPVSGDPARLQQVVVNLLANAIKFTEAGGRIGVTLAGHGGQARLEVSDTGTGIAADSLPQIFQAFARADPPKARAQGGLGLGLTIASHLVQVHGGTIRAQSPGTGKGATFSVTLPLLVGHSLGATAPETAASAGSGHERRVCGRGHGDMRSESVPSTSVAAR